jgi:hypothetical protein
MPFTVEQFLGIFHSYNLSVFPMQIIAYALGLVALFLVFKNRSGQLISAILSFMWLWNGIVYHGFFFSSINKAAFGFAAIFVLQGLLFAWSGVFRKKLTFDYPKSGSFMAMAVLAILYSMVIYPALGMLLGHVYPKAPMFGIAPCPTTIFTFGLLLLAGPRTPRYLVIFPLVWSVIGFGAAMNFGIKEDIGLLITGIGATALILYRAKKTKKAASMAPQGTMVTV